MAGAGKNPQKEGERDFEPLSVLPPSRDFGIEGERCVEPTNDQDPNYYHKVVDCQWACPAHTNVPGYIRMIAQGQFDDAYMLNRESNVFPGILGRTCDRPCETGWTVSPSPFVDSSASRRT